MFTANLRDIHATAVGLTQGHHVGLAPESMTVPPMVRDVLWSSVHMASHDADFFYTLGTGKIEPHNLARVMLHYAMVNSSVVSFEALVDEWREFHLVVSTDNMLWRNLVAYVVGASTDKAVALEKMGRMPAEAIRDWMRTKLGTLAKSAHFEMLLHIEADYAVSNLAQLGLILPGTSFVYRVDRLISFPDYHAYVAAVRATVLSDMFDSLAMADMTMVKAHLTAKQSVSPSLIANRLAAAAVQAHDRVSGRYNAKDIVDATFELIYRAQDVSTPDALQPSGRIRESEGFNRLLGNATIFAAVQQMVAEQGIRPTPFTEEQLAAVVIPMFNQAVMNISPFKERSVADAVAHLGHKSHSDYDGSRSHVAIYEDWSFSKAGTAFVPVRQSRAGHGRYLMRDITVSDTLSAALAPIAEMFAVKPFVERYLQAMALPPAGHWNVLSNGTELLFALPSISSTPLPAGVSATSLMEALREGNVGTALVSALELEVEDGDAEGDISSHARRVDALLRNYYLAVFCYAIRCGGTTQVGPVETENGSNLVCVWRFSADTKVPLGQAAIVGGQVTTTEPLERISYAQDSEPSMTVVTQPLPLGDYEKSLHMWDWRAASLPVVYNDTYELTVGSNLYKVHINETDVLSLGYTRDRLRFHIPSSARAIVEMWWTWYSSTIASLTAMKAGTSDTLVLAAIEGRMMNANVILVQRLRAIGSSPVGANLSRVVNHRVAVQMRGLGKLDQMRQLYVTPHEIRNSVWSGLVILQMLGLLAPAEAASLNQQLSASGALATVMALAD